LSGEFESCVNTSLHAHLYLHENTEDTNDLVEKYVFGYFFSFCNMDQGEYVIWNKLYVSYHHFIPLVFPTDAK